MPETTAQKKWPKHLKHVVVKVQIAIAGDGAGKTCLVYTQDRKVQGEFIASPSLLNALHGDVKAFFTAILVADEEAGEGKYKINLRARILNRNW